MFKRIARNQKRRELDEELGLDDDAKQMFGLKDNDSDDSNSDSESQLSDDDAADLDPGFAAKMRTEWLAAEGEDSEDEGDEGESDEEELDLDDDFDDDPPISLDDAVKNPIYDLPLSSQNERSCITCSKKVLKHDRMVESHLSSAAHIRRFKKFCELAESTKNRSKDPRRIAASISLTTKPTLNAEGLSNRALKRKRKLEAVKQKREKRKQIIERKKKSANKHEETDVGNKENKKRKVERTNKTSAAPAVLPNPDSRTSEKPHKRRKLSHAETAEQESGGSEGGKNAISEERTAPYKSSKKAKTKVKLDLEKADAQIPAGSESKSKGKDKIAAPQERNEKAPKVKSFKSGSNNKDENAHSIKKRDLLKMKTKGHMSREHAGRFAKLSETRVVKDKSDRKSRREESGAVRKASIARKKPVRYFDGPEDGELESKKIVAKSEAQKRNHAAGEVGANRLQKSLSRQVEQAPDDLAIFD